MVVTLYCMTTKKKFDVDNPEVVILKNGRFAYRAMCPTKGKEGKDLFAYKFCSSEDHKRYTDSLTTSNAPSSGCPSQPASTEPIAE